MPESPSSDAPDAVDADSAADGVDHADTRARFREALERKKNRNAAGFAAGPGDPKSSGAHGAAGAKRVFRRKSG